MTQYKRRKDANHADIARAFEDLGCAVADTSNVPSCPGFTDLVISKFGEDSLVEVKHENNDFTDAQIKFRQRWRGTLHTARNFDDVQKVVEWLRRRALMWKGVR